MSDQGDIGNADKLASRIDVGDPDPKKEILRFLRVPYLLSQRVLKLARDNQAFHVLGVVIARQALRLVLRLNAEVSKDGPTRAQLDERIKLQDQIVDLEAILREPGSRGQLEDSASEGKQHRGLDSSPHQELSIVSQEQVTQPDLDGAAYQQCVSLIKKQYDLFFPPSPAREENFKVLLNYSISFGAGQQSRGLGQIGDATADSISDSTHYMDFKMTVPIVDVPAIPIHIDEPGVDDDGAGSSQQLGSRSSVDPLTTLSHNFSTLPLGTPPLSSRLTQGFSSMEPYGAMHQGVAVSTPPTVSIPTKSAILKMKTFSDRNTAYDIRYIFEESDGHPKTYVCVYKMGEHEIGRGELATNLRDTKVSAAEKAFKYLEELGYFKGGRFWYVSCIQLYRHTQLRVR